MKMIKLLFKLIFLQTLKISFTRTFFHSNVFPDPDRATESKDYPSGPHTNLYMFEAEILATL